MITRNLRVKRLYTAGQFQNLEFEDSVEGLPEELAFDDTAIKFLSNIMILRLDAQERRYFKIREETRGMSHEEVIEILEAQKAEETAKLLDHLKNKQE